MLAAYKAGDVPNRQARDEHVVLALAVVTCRHLIALPERRLESVGRLALKTSLLTCHHAVDIGEEERMFLILHHAMAADLLACLARELLRHNVLELVAPVDRLAVRDVFRHNLPRLLEPKLVLALPRIHTNNRACITATDALRAHLEPCMSVRHLSDRHNHLCHENHSNLWYNNHNQ